MTKAVASVLVYFQKSTAGGESAQADFVPFLAAILIAG
jgi:hypothetical protein